MSKDIDDVLLVSKSKTSVSEALTVVVSHLYQQRWLINPDRFKGLLAK